MIDDPVFTAEESAKIRSNFPMLAGYTFLNSASMAPLPAPSRDAMSALLAGQSERGYLGMEEWKKKAAETRALAAKITGAGEDEVAFIRNTSDGVSLVASGYPWREGDEVIINDLEFPSNVYPWLNLERLGVIVRVVKSENGRVTLDAIRAALTPRTRIVAISSVQFSTGQRTDLAALGQMAREEGFFLFVDAIQSLGLIPMDVKGLNIDFLACGGHKWLCAPEGIGIFFIDRKEMGLLRLTRVGWNTVADCHNFGKIDFTIRPGAERFEEGTPNLVGIYGLAESLRLVMSMGVEHNFSHVLALNEKLVDGLKSKGYKVLSPMGAEERSGILIFSAPDPERNGEILKKFAESKILVIERGDGIRVSPHFFNTFEDIEKLLGEL
ncbi:MAG: aminotransferase class V-fold PLP-dependent enzyme [Candidatus Nitrospinota bacterium M3_3B_026]